MNITMTSNTTAFKIDEHFETWRLFHPIYIFFFCIPVTFHYFLVLRAIRKFHETNGFYFIFFLMGVSDVYYLSAMLGCEVLNLLQRLPKVIFVTCVVSTYFGVFFNILSNCLLSINRLFATCVSYNTYFSNFRIKIYFILIFLLSFIATLPGGIVMYIYWYKDYGTQAQYSKTGWESFNAHRTIIISMMLSYDLLAVSSSVCTIYRLKKYKISYDKSLLLVTVLHIFPGAFASLFNLDMMFQFTGASKFTNELPRFLFFLVSFNSLTIFGTNRRVRRYYYRTVFFWKLEVKKAMSQPTMTVTPGTDVVTLF